MLTYLFQEWVNNETDVELLIETQQVINQRKEIITGPTQVIGFKTYTDVNKIK
tara:strand:+ start:612 stop:770 length:159 start_codon:yes stop_codon:yes gene_type:complete